MKVKATNKKLWRNYIKVISMTAGTLSLVFTIVDIEQNLRIAISAFCLIALVITFIIMLCAANKMRLRKLCINGTEVMIKEGNIFEQQGIKVIGFNEFFDTQVDDGIIARNSLNGIYITQFSRGAESLNDSIESDIYLSKQIIDNNVTRPLGGKPIKYKIGTICPVDEYFLLAFTHFDDSNRAFLSIDDYFSCLLNMWREIDRLYAGKNVAVPLLGGGITRLNGGNISDEDLLHYMLQTFKASGVCLKNAGITIVIDKNVMSRINIFDIEE